MHESVIDWLVKLWDWVDAAAPNCVTRKFSLNRLASNFLFGYASSDESGVFDVLAKDDDHTINIP